MKKYVYIDGLKVNYHKEGVGDPMILLHGWASDIESWNGIKKNLMKRFTLYYFDLPGYGSNSSYIEYYTIENYAKFLYEFITKLKLSNFILLGQSMGSAIIVDFVLKYSDKVKIRKIILSSLVVRSPNLYSKIRIKILKKYQFTHYLVGFVHNLLIESQETRLYKDFIAKFIYLKDSIYNKKIILTSSNGLMRMSKEIYIGCLISILSFNSQDALKKIINKINYALIYGEKDKLTHYKRVSNLKNVYILKNGTHNTFKYYKKIFTEILENTDIG